MKNKVFDFTVQACWLCLFLTLSFAMQKISPDRSDLVFESKSFLLDRAYEYDAATAETHYVHWLTVVFNGVRWLGLTGSLGWVLLTIILRRDHRRYRKPAAK